MDSRSSAHDEDHSGRPFPSVPLERESTGSHEWEDFPCEPATAGEAGPAVARGTSGKFARSFRLPTSFPRKRESTKNRELRDAPCEAQRREGPGTGGPAAIRFDRVCKRFGRRQVLDRLSFAVAAGESVALIGTNGAGKTTCIRGLLDLCALECGTIEIFGVPHTTPRARAGLAFLPERFLPPWYLRGRDFLRYMARLYGTACREDRMREICAHLELEAEALARPARDYSKGMAQKLGLAAALLSGRALLVLDEPMSGLDPKARRLVRRELQRHRAGGGTLFFSTHVLADLPALCDRIAILHAGRIAFAGTVHACRRRFRASSLEDAFLRCIGADSAPACRPAARRTTPPPGSPRG